MKLLFKNDILTKAVIILIMLFCITISIFLISSIIKLWQVKSWYPDLNISKYVLIILFIFSLLILFIRFEIKLIKRISNTSNLKEK